jgi:hypothetical protein
MARRGQDTGNSLHAPLRTQVDGLTARRAFEDLAFQTNPRTLVDVIWDFNGKFASGYGEGLATRATGTPTGVAQVANSANGEITATLAATSEAEFSGVDWTDELNIPANSLPFFEARIKTPAVALVAAEDIVIGLATAYNATMNSISKYVRFRLSGSNDLLVEGKDGTTTNNAVATGTTLLAATYNLFTIEQKRSNNRYYFFLNDDLVGVLAQDAFAATDLLQPMIGIRKASGTTAPAITIDFVRLQWHRF